MRRSAAARPQPQPARGPGAYPIGVDLGFDAVRLLQLRADGAADGRLSVFALYRGDLSESEHDPVVRLDAGLALLRDALRSGRFEGRRVVAALPKQVLHTRTLRLPPAPWPNEPVFRQEAAAALPIPLDDAQLINIDAGELRHAGDRRREVIALAAERGEVDEHLERLHQAGAIIEALEPQAIALHRAADHGIDPATSSEAIAILDIGAQSSALVIGRAGRVCLTKSIDVGGNRLTSAVSKRLGISGDEARRLRARADAAAPVNAAVDAPNAAVARAVRDAIRAPAEELAAAVVMCLRYYAVSFRGRFPARLLVGGGEARFTEIRDILHRVTGLTVEPTDPFADIARDVDEPDDLPAEWCLALGLALRSAVVAAPDRGPLLGQVLDVVLPPDAPASAAPAPAPEVTHA